MSNNLSESFEKFKRAMYRRIEYKNRRRFGVKTDFTYEQFDKLMKYTPLFTEYKAYRRSSFDKHLCPSIDRIDNSKCYTLDNIQIISFRENTLKGPRDENGAIALAPKPLNSGLRVWRYLREHHGVSAWTWANKLGFSMSFVSNAESVGITLNLARLAHGLKIAQVEPELAGELIAEQLKDLMKMSDEDLRLKM